MVKYEFETMEDYEKRMKKCKINWVFNIFIYGIFGFVIGLMQVTQPLAMLFKYISISLLAMMILSWVSMVFNYDEELKHTKEIEYLKKNNTINKMTKK